MEVVLHNLLANALAYGNGHVGDHGTCAEGVVLVRVADDGPGMAAERVPHIFERFYRAARGQHRARAGTGLGLAICKAFVEAHGGAIWAESGREERRSFSFYPCPAVDAAERRASPSPSRRAHRSPHVEA